MKKLLVILMLTLAFLAPLTFTGCNTPPGKVAYNTVAITAVSGDTAIHIWKDYVAQQKQAGTPVPLNQELQAKKAWNAFQDARDAVLKAGVAYSTSVGDTNAAFGALGTLNATVAAMAAASSELVNLITSFGVKLN